MRIEFVHPERDPTSWHGSTLRVGHANDNDLVLAGQGIAPHHLTLRNDARGVVLEVVPGLERVYVNARPVRERALLLAGDTIGVGDTCMRLCADPAVGAQPPSAEGERPLAASLRALAGPLSGRVWSIGGGLDLGGDDDRPLHLPGHAHASLHMGWRDGALWLEGSVPPTHPLRVNGHVVDAVQLKHGDQIALGPHRFVVDAASLGESMDAIAAEEHEPLPEESAGPRGEVWWLIVTAAALALVIALVLLVQL